MVRDTEEDVLRADESDERALTLRVTALQRQEQTLKQEIAQLQERYEYQLQQQSQESQVMLRNLVDATMAELSQKHQTLQREVDQLEQRRERIREEMRSNFAGVSQDLAVRVQGFKDYLVGSLQDLATAAEQLQLSVPDNPPSPSPIPLDLPSARPRQSDPREQDRLSQPSSSPSRSPLSSPEQGRSPVSSKRGFDSDAKHIRQILDQYRHSPDYYGAPWQLRRTFEPVHARRVSQWLFDHAGRGSLKSMGSRLQNILVASAIISVLRVMKGDRVRILILSDSPGRLGEWRRGLQDCLGISRSDFGAQQGVALFEAPEAVCQRADRLIEQGNQPLILIDNSEDKVHLSLLQYPLWLAFAPDPREIPMY